MDKMITTKIGGKTRFLNYSVAVMFDMHDKFGTIQDALDLIAQDGRKSFEAVKWFAVQMANDAELCRRDEGYKPAPMTKESDISIRMSPLDYEELKSAVIDAITLGYHRETKNEDETDLGLAELQRKKAAAGE